MIQAFLSADLGSNVVLTLTSPFMKETDKTLRLLVLIYRERIDKNLIFPLLLSISHINEIPY